MVQIKMGQSELFAGQIADHPTVHILGI